jgi:ribosomal protein L31E
MPEATQAEIGRRLYHVQREKRVERAVKLIQQGLGPEWKTFTEEKIVLLGHLLQCTWNTIDQEIWEKIPFAHTKKSDIDRILLFGEGVRPGKNPTPEAVGEIRKILLALN